MCLSHRRLPSWFQNQGLDVASTNAISRHKRGDSQVIRYNVAMTTTTGVVQTNNLISGSLLHTLPAVFFYH